MPRGYDNPDTDAIAQKMQTVLGTAAKVEQAVKSLTQLAKDPVSEAEIQRQLKLDDEAAELLCSLAVLQSAVTPVVKAVCPNGHVCERRLPHIIPPHVICDACGQPAPIKAHDIRYVA